MFCIRKIFLLKTLLLFLISNNESNGQNLIPNGSFEQYTGCPTYFNQLDSSIHWINPTNASPDFYNQCATAWVGVPNSFYGYQQPHTGGAFAAVILKVPADPDYREYLEVPLTSTLVAQTSYYFQMYINAANNYKYISDAIEVYFSDTAIVNVQTRTNLLFNAQIVNVPGNLADTLDWKLMSGTYIAHGGETHLIIGNFKADSATNLFTIDPTATWDYAYVFIDDVSLWITNNVTQQSCDSFLWNGQTYFSSGVFSQSLISNAGIDSLVTMNLTIANSNVFNITKSVCDFYSMNGQTYNTTGFYIQQFTNMHGCDSTVILNLIINNNHSSVVSVIECNSYNLNGENFTYSGLYTQLLSTVGGCDSTIFLDLTINAVNDSIIKSGDTLISLATNARYQWVNCDLDNSFIVDETNPYYLASTNGNYAVIVNENGCSALSECYPINSFNACGNNIVIYPNPNKGEVTVRLEKMYETVSVEIINTTGQMVYHDKWNETNQLNYKLDMPLGLYFILITINDIRNTCKLIIMN